MSVDEAIYRKPTRTVPFLQFVVAYPIDGSSSAILSTPPIQRSKNLQQETIIYDLSSSIASEFLPLQSQYDTDYKPMFIDHPLQNTNITSPRAILILHTFFSHLPLLSTALSYPTFSSSPFNLPPHSSGLKTNHLHPYSPPQYGTLIHTPNTVFTSSFTLSLHASNIPLLSASSRSFFRILPIKLSKLHHYPIPPPSKPFRDGYRS